MTDQQKLFKFIVNGPRAQVEQACSFIENCGMDVEVISLVEDEGKWRGEIYSFLLPDLVAVKEMLVDCLGPSFRELQLEINDIPDIDWVAHVQSELRPVKAGRFFIHGQHDRDLAANQSFAIEIDAAQAFGTAHHDTTLGCLVALDELAEEQNFHNILDLGTGTGVLIIAAHKLWPKACLTASDIDPVSIDIARQNCLLNNVSNQIDLIIGDGCNQKEFQQRVPFDLIIANILAGPLIEMAPSIKTSLNVGGRLILSGLLTNQTDQVITAYEQCDLRLDQRSAFGEWATLQFIN